MELRNNTEVSIENGVIDENPVNIVLLISKCAVQNSSNYKCQRLVCAYPIK